MNKYMYFVLAAIVCIVDAKCVYYRLDGSRYLPPSTELYYGNCSIGVQAQQLPRFASCVNDTAFSTDCITSTYDYYMGACDPNMKCIMWIPAYLPLVDVMPTEQPSQVIACITNKQVFDTELSKFSKRVAVTTLYFNIIHAGYYVLIVNLLPFNANFSGSISLYGARQRLLLSDYTEGNVITYYQHYRKHCTKARFTVIAAGNIDALTGLRSSVLAYQQF